MSEHTKRCACCGRAATRGVVIRVKVIDWRTDWLCDECVAAFDWPAWEHPDEFIYDYQALLAA